MSEVDDNSVDLIPTDPPYGLSFMGKQWDKALPPIEIWRECLRVLKPGAFAFVMSSTRQDCLARMIISLEDAGFKIGFTSLYWAYPSGFPKAQNIAKAIEKRHREPDRIDNVKGCGGMISDKGYNVTKHHLIYTKDTGERIGNNQGRFPANLLVSGDCLNVASQGAMAPVKSGQKGFGGQIYGKYKTSGDDGNSFYSDKETSKSFSRYFSLDAWWNERIKHLPDSVQKTFPYLICSKASKQEKNRGCEELYWEKDKSAFGYHQIDRERYTWLGEEEERIYKETGKHISLRAWGNIHTTVKPMSLFSYLITIGSRENDITLDPSWDQVLLLVQPKH